MEPVYLRHLQFLSITYVTGSQATADKIVLSVGMACVGRLIGILEKVLAKPATRHDKPVGYCLGTCTVVHPWMWRLPTNGDVGSGLPCEPKPIHGPKTTEIA